MIKIFSRPQGVSFVFLGLFFIAVVFFSTGADAAGKPSLEATRKIAAGKELSVDYAQPTISLEEVINPSSSMEGDYPVLLYGTRPMYASGFFWMDNHRVILNDIEGSGNNDRVIKVWDVDNDKISIYGQGSVGCYANDMIQRKIYKAGASPTAPGILQKGPLGQEKDFVFDKSIPTYDNKFECGDQPSPFTTQHVKEHPEDMVVALRDGHGFLVTGKRTFLSDGRTDNIWEQNAIMLHVPGREPKNISVPSKNVFVADYYPFVSAYVLYNATVGYRNIHLFLLNGEMRTVKPPTGISDGSYPVLTRRGLLWLRGSVLPNPTNGIYLSRGEKVKKISSENVHGGKVSPDGCRMTYTTTAVDLFGKVTRPTLKVINLCAGEK